MKSFQFLIVVIILTFTTDFFAQKSNSILKTRVESMIGKKMGEHGIPGLAIGIVKNGRVVYAKGFGVAKAGGDSPVTTRSIFHMASVTKLFTATAVMQLAERGKIKLDTRVIDYLPYFRMKDGRYRQITIRQLLTHTSGIPFIEENPFELKPEYDAGALERHVRALSGFELSFAPGEKTEYSNYGYDVLGDIIAKVAGETYEDYVKQNVLQPLGMKSSTLLVREVPAKSLLTPHFSDEAGKVAVTDKFPYTRAFAPSADLYSNVEDMMRWAIASLNKGVIGRRRILKTETYNLMWRQPANPTTDENGFMLSKKIGFAWWSWNYRGRLLVGHGGADLGFNSFILLAPDEKAGVVVMGNLYPAKENYLPTGQYYVTDIAKSVMQLLLSGSK